jgi:cardiolipin synthase
MRHSCKRIELHELGELRGLQLVRSFLAYHFTRRYPGWASWLPRHVPRLMHPLSDHLKPQE